MRAILAIICLVLVSTSFQAQDTVYARRAISFLTSKKCFGRGYVKNGLGNARKYLVGEIKKQGLKPLFGSEFTQAFYHSVNTFPGKMDVTLNGRRLKPGIDFIVDPSSTALKGDLELKQKDSTHFLDASTNGRVTLELKKKLTFSVDGGSSGICELLIDKNRVKEQPARLKVNIQNKVLPHFRSENIGAFIPGTSASDSLFVFTAHYDHLGGMGKNTFFPGANDNASGVSFVLNLIKYYKAHPPKYKTVFIFFAGEEAGLLGSKYLTENPPFNLSKIKFLINLDLLGTGDDGIMVVNGAIHEKEFNKLLTINSEKKLLKEIKKRGKAANSDHYWFSEKGVPCFFIYTMGGIGAYHDVFDIGKTLPLTDYVDVFNLLVEFVDRL